MEPLDPTLVNEDNQNSKLIICRVCSTKILKPTFGTLVTQEMPLAVDAQQTEDVKYWWHIQDMFHFENIGFTRVASAAATVKFLCCANCERGILGVQFLDTEKILLCHHRISYLS